MQIRMTRYTYCQAYPPMYPKDSGVFKFKVHKILSGVTSKWEGASNDIGVAENGDNYNL